MIWEYRGTNPEPPNFRRALGVFVVHLCESAKIQPIFDRICRSFSDPSISRLDSDAEPGVGDLCESWRFLSTQGMQHVDCRINNVEPPAIENRGIRTISRAEDILESIRIFHRDACNSGVFQHEPMPSPPRHWEPIDTGDGDSDNDADSGDEDDKDDNEDDDGDGGGGGRGGKGKGGRKGKEQKHDRRRRPQQVHHYNSKKQGGAGGQPANFPDRLIDRWSKMPWRNMLGSISENKENVVPAPLSQDASRIGGQQVQEWAPNQIFEHGECSREREMMDCDKDQNTWIMITDLYSLMDVASWNSIMQMKGKGTKLVIPMIVVRELDHLKQQDSLSGERALSVLKWIHDCMEHESPWIHVQSSCDMLSEAQLRPIERCQAEGTAGCLHKHNLSSRTSEDYVLKCANHLKQVPSKETVVILSDIASLKAKAEQEGVLCESAKDFCETLLYACPNKASRSNRVVSSHEESKGLRILLDRPVHSNNYVGQY